MLDQRVEGQWVGWEKIKAFIKPYSGLFFLSIFALWVFAVLPVSAEDIRLLRSDRSGVLLSYELGMTERRTITSGSRQMDLLTVEGCGFTGEPGTPMLPVRSVLIGIPFDAQVSLRIVDATSSVEDGYDLLPVPHIEVESGDEGAFAREVFLKDEQVYNKDIFLPEEAVKLSQPMSLRNQRVVKLELFPFRYNPKHGQVQKYRRIVVELLFSYQKGIGDDLQYERLDEDEDLYRKTIINYEQARRWRRRRLKRPRVSVTPLGQGRWVKVKVDEDGLYRIDWDDLRELGISVEDIDPQRIRMYYGGGRELPRDTVTTPPELKEIPIFVDTESRYILFYGNGLSGWDYDPKEAEFTHFMNHYTRENCYWLTLDGGGEGLRMVSRDGRPWRDAVIRPSTFRQRIHMEMERFSTFGDETGGSGEEWYWHEFSGLMARRYPLRVSYPDTTDTSWIKIRMTGGEKYNSHLFYVSLNNSGLGTINFKAGQHSGKVVTFESAGLLRSGTNWLSIRYLKASAKPEYYPRLDWYEYEYSRKFVADGEELLFTSPVATGTAEFGISGFSSPDVWIFEVSDPFGVSQIVGASFENGVLTFQDSVRSPRPQQYYVLSESKWKKPKGLELYEPSSDLRRDLVGLNYVVVSHRDFLTEAQRLADWRSEQGLKTAVVDVEDVYNQFSWGLFDPTAIRNFMKYLFENQNPDLEYLLLFGDGSFDYKNNSGRSPNNWIPPYTHRDTSTDDWFVSFDPLPDMAVGRLPARTPEEARIMVDKIIEYEERVERGVWQNTVILLADDEHVRGRYDGIIDYTSDTDSIATGYLPKKLDQVKVYLTEYPLDAFGRKPDAKREFIDAFNRGALLINFIGHGRYDVLTHEEVFNVASDIRLLSNGRRLPLFFGATCSAAHFDHPMNESLTERLVRLEGGGLVAAIGPTRLAWNAPNVDLNKLFYRQLFRSSGPPERVGKALWMAKLLSWLKANSAKFALIGDPALRLAMPEVDLSLSVSPDTLMALGQIEISGVVPGSQPSGEVYIRVFDSANLTRYDVLLDTQRRGRIITGSIGYILPGAPIFRGVFPLEKGRFSALVRIPKDITYGGEMGRVSVFVWNDQFDGTAAIDSLYVGGTSYAFENDITGPAITLGIAGQNFMDGDPIPPSPVIRAVIEDESGINITREIGHGITLRVDGGEIMDVTDYFLYENSYRRGTLEYQLKDLTPGEHIIELKAWDNFNNSSKESVRVDVVPEDRFSITEVLFYPNPLDPADASEAAFTYMLTQPARRVRIKVFSIFGRLVDQLDGGTSRGYNQVDWMPPRLANGVYLYKIIAEGTDGKKAEAIDRIAVLR